MKARYSSELTGNERTYSDEVPDVTISIPDQPDVYSRAAGTNSSLGQFLVVICFETNILSKLL